MKTQHVATVVGKDNVREIGQSLITTTCCISTRPVDGPRGTTGPRNENLHQSSSKALATLALESRVVADFFMRWDMETKHVDDFYSSKPFIHLFIYYRKKKIS